MTHKILVIDDHPETLSIIQNVLEQHGYLVAAARSGFRGLALAEADPPDLVMVDGMMPEMDGWEVCRRLRENEKLAHIPIVMFSAVEEAEQKLAGFNAGADDYLTKPTEPDELLERVQILLQSVAPRPEISPETVALKTQYMTQEPPAQTPTGRLSSEGILIVVLGTRGGVGTTTLAINLAAALSQRQIPTTLVDLDQGHVALYLKKKAKTAVHQLPQPVTTPAQLVDSDALVAYSRHLQLLLTQVSPMQVEPIKRDRLLPMLSVLRRPGHAVVVDAGRGVTAEKLLLFAKADQIVICLRPERVALAAAKLLLSQWRRASLPQTILHLALLDFWSGRDIPAKVVEGYLGRPLSAVIPIPLQEFVQATNKGVPLIELYADGQTAVQFNELAYRLVKI